MTTEDFPALPGALPPSVGMSNLLGVGGGGSGLLENVTQQQQQQQQQRDGVVAPGTTTTNASVNVATASNQGSKNPLSGGSGMYSIDLENNSQQHGGVGRESGLLGGGSGGVGVGGLASLGVPSSQQQSNNNNTHQQPRSSSGNPPSSTSSSMPSSSTGTAVGAAGSALNGDYGLLGLLGVIRMSDADRNALALGSDLTSLGLNLNSPDQLYSTFASPWSDSPTTREPQYQLPMCYYMQPPALKTGHLSKFHLETLFYIFYALPKDVLQAYAAQELYTRDWRYHVDLKLWFIRASPADGVPNSNNGIQYIYFDINSWDRRLYSGNMHQNITSGLLSEEDVRVKFPNS